jgi:L-Ala-D/L-Glu epimerase
VEGPKGSGRVETTVDVVVTEIADGEGRGRGEGVPLQRYDESIDSVVAALDAMKGAVFSGLDRDALQHALPPGAARNALDAHSGTSMRSALTAA